MASDPEDRVLADRAGNRDVDPDPDARAQQTLEAPQSKLSRGTHGALVRGRPRPLLEGTTAARTADHDPRPRRGVDDKEAYARTPGREPARDAHDGEGADQPQRRR